MNNQLPNTPHQRRRVWLQVATLLICWSVIAYVFIQDAGRNVANAQAGLTCSAAFQIDTTMANGARWEMCWDQRSAEGIVYYDIHFTTPDGTRRKVLGQASVAQIHVPYDSGSPRYHDVTDYGLGTNQVDLAVADCPHGTLLPNGATTPVCLAVESRGFAYGKEVSGSNDSRMGEMLTLYSVSDIVYNYIPMWEFHDDGTIAPSMGATGILVVYGGGSDHQWYVGPDHSSNSNARNHTHNYFWRLDFDLDGSDNDVVNTFEFTQAGSNNRERVINSTDITVESSMDNNQETFRSWRIRDTVTTNSEGSAISYHFYPDASHVYRGRTDNEEFTLHDVYITNNDSCERAVSHNDLISSGCGSDVNDFIDGESVNGGSTDPVLWVRATFHHLPRHEDQPRMPVHWNRFEIRPHDWTSDNQSVGATTLAPEITLSQTINGMTPNSDTGPFIAAGTTMTTSYTVENTGDYVLDITLVDDAMGTLTCPDYELDPAESVTCEYVTTAQAGQYVGGGIVTGVPQSDGIGSVTAEDTGRYFGYTAELILNKTTNGIDTGDLDSMILLTGDPVSWEYEIENSGTVTLTIALNDSEEGAISCPDTTLSPAETVTCTHNGIVAAGVYSNTATVIGTPSGALVLAPVTAVNASDVSAYTGHGATAINGTLASIIERGSNFEMAMLPLIVITLAAAIQLGIWQRRNM